MFAGLVVGIGYTTYQFFERPTVEPFSLETEYVSQSEFVALQQEFDSIVEEHDARVALREVERRAKMDSRFAHSCHALVHSIGHTAYHTYDDFGVAMLYAEPVCNVGYIHGVSQSHFAHASDIANEVQQVCAEYDIDSSIGWECVHGVGHGLMLGTDNDVPQSLEYCDLFSRDEERYACYTGLFMENFHTNEMFHPTDFLDTEEPFRVCTGLAEQYQKACNHYAIHYYIRANENDFQAALDYCGQLDRALRVDCAGGVGDLAIKEHIDQPLHVEKLCMTADTTFMQNSCIANMTALYTNQFGVRADGLRLCEQLQSGNASVCEHVVEQIPSDFYEAYSL